MNPDPPVPEAKPQTAPGGPGTGARTREDASLAIVRRDPGLLVLTLRGDWLMRAGLPGLALIVWGEDTQVSLGIGLGLTGYGMAVAGFSTWVLWGLTRGPGDR